MSGKADKWAVLRETSRVVHEWHQARSSDWWETHDAWVRCVRLLEAIEERFPERASGQDWDEKQAVVKRLWNEAEAAHDEWLASNPPPAWLPGQSDFPRTPATLLREIAHMESFKNRPQAMFNAVADGWRELAALTPSDLELLRDVDEAANPSRGLRLIKEWCTAAITTPAAEEAAVTEPAKVADGKAVVFLKPANAYALAGIEHLAGPARSKAYAKLHATLDDGDKIVSGNGVKVRADKWAALCKAFHAATPAAEGWRDPLPQTIEKMKLAILQERGN